MGVTVGLTLVLTAVKYVRKRSDRHRGGIDHRMSAGGRQDKHDHLGVIDHRTGINGPEEVVAR